MQGKTVLVTGATDGLGRGLARELAAAGATVLMHGRDPDRIRATREQVGSGRTYQADFASLAEVGRMADRSSTRSRDWTCSSTTLASAPRSPAAGSGWRARTATSCASPSTTSPDTC